MPMLNVYVDEETLERLQWFAGQDPQGRTVEELAEAAVAEAGIRADNRPIVRVTITVPDGRTVPMPELEISSRPSGREPRR